MEDVDDDHRTPNDGRITVTLPKSSSGGGAREDCWSEAATSILIDAWGERYLALSRGNLKQKHWKEVADIVNGSREMHGRSSKTDMQCKNRIDTVKKKYKLEKSKIACSDAEISRWPFFHKLDHLIGPAAKTSTPSAVIPRLQNNQKMQRQPAPEESDSSETDSPESTDTYPPKPAKKRRVSIPNPNSTATSNPKGRKSHDGGRVKKSSSIGELTNAILNLGEAYEQAENAKLRQVVEMEKHRMKFTKDLELQRMQLFMKTQLEITQMKQNAMSSCRNKAGGSNHFHHQLHMNDNNNVSNLNSDST